MTQTQAQSSAASPATYPSSVAAAVAAPQPPAPEKAAPHWTAYFGVGLSLITAVMGSFAAYEVHTAHIDDHDQEHTEQIKDHEARLRPLELLPGRITGLEKQSDRMEQKLDQALNKK